MTRLTSRFLHAWGHVRSGFTAKGFSFVEVLAAVSIIGIIVFLAIPNLIRIKEDGEKSLAISRAEALNIAMAAYVQANGTNATWSTNSSTAYGYLRPYLAFAPTNMSGYMISGYNVGFPSSLTNLTRVTLTDSSGNAVPGY